MWPFLQNWVRGDTDFPNTLGMCLRENTMNPPAYQIGTQNWDPYIYRRLKTVADFEKYFSKYLLEFVCIFPDISRKWLVIEEKFDHLFFFGKGVIPLGHSFSREWRWDSFSPNTMFLVNIAWSSLHFYLWIKVAHNWWTSCYLHIDGLIKLGPMFLKNCNLFPKNYLKILTEKSRILHGYKI